MSTQPQSGSVPPQSTPTPASAQGTDAKPSKPRSPVERAIVWGLIAVLLIVVGLEWWGKRNYQKSLDAVRAALQASDADAKAKPLTLEEIPALLSGNPSVEEEAEIITMRLGKHQTKTYTWRGIFKTYSFMLSASFGDGNVIDVSDPAEEMASRAEMDRLVEQVKEASKNRPPEVERGPIRRGFPPTGGAAATQSPSVEAKPEEPAPASEAKPEPAPNGTEPAATEPAQPEAPASQPEASAPATEDPKPAEPAPANPSAEQPTETK